MRINRVVKVDHKLGYDRLENVHSVRIDPSGALIVMHGNLLTDIAFAAGQWTRYEFTTEISK